MLASSLLPKYLSLTDTRIRDGIHATLGTLMINLARGWDYFGHAENYVPLGSPEFYLGPFADAVGSLKLREDTYLDYRNNLSQQKSVGQQRLAAVQAAGEELEE